MAAKATIGAKLVLEGEKEYKQSLKDIAAAQKELRSEMKLAQAEYKDNAESVEALSKQYEIMGKQVEAQEKKVSVYQKAVDEMTKRQKEWKENTEELSKAYDSANEKLEEVIAQYGEGSKEAKEQAQAVQELKNKMDLSNEAYDKQNRKLTEWKTSLNNAQTDLIGMQSDLNATKNKMDEAAQETEEGADAVKKYGSEVEDASAKTSAFGDVLKATLAADIIKAGVEKLIEGLKTISSAVVETGSNFESSMSQVAATMGMTSEEIQNGSKDYETLANAAKECGKTTQFSASQAAEALNYLALAGYDASKAAETLPKVLNLAAAGGLDLAYASDLVTDSMAALGMETSELDSYIDQMARTAQKSNTSVSQLGEATLVVAGMASTTGQSIETLNAELGVLANNGIKGAEGGTHLRNVLERLVAPTEKGALALERLGVSTQDSSGNVRDLNDILVDLNAALDGLGQAEKAQVIKNIFKSTDISAVNALLKGTGQEFNNLKTEIENSTGAAEEMAATMNDNLTGKVTILQSALEGLGITAYEKIDGVLKNSVDHATEAVGRLQASAETGELGESMDEFAESLDQAAESVIEFAEDALPVMIDGLSWILDNGDTVIAAVTGIGAAHLTYTTIIPTMTALVEAWKAYKTANEGATVSQYLLNAAMNANPAGILITAIAGLTAAMGAYALIASTQKTEMEELNQKYRDQINTIDSDIQKRKESSAANETEISAIRTLKEELTQLNSKEQLSTDEKTRMKMVVDQLNAALPDLNLVIDEQTGKLAENTEGWEANAEAQLLALEAQFRQEEATEIAREHYEVQKQLNEVTEERIELEQQLAEAQEEYNEYMSDATNITNDAWIALDGLKTGEQERLERINELTGALETHTTQEEELSSRLTELTGEYDEINAKIAEQNEVVQETTSSIIEYNGKMYEIPAANQSTVQSIEELQTSYYDALAAAEESISKQVGLFTELSAQSELTISQMNERWQGNAEVMSQYSEDLVAASQLVNSGASPEFEQVLEAIMDMGVDGAGYLHELVTAAEEDGEAFNEAIESFMEMEEAKGVLEETLADIQTGYTEGMEELLGIQEEQGTNLNEQIDATGKEAIEIATVNNDAVVEDTKISIQEISTEIDTQKPIVVEKVRLFAQDIVKTTETELQMADGRSIKFFTIGRAIPESLAAGIEDGSALVVDAIVAMVEAAVNAVDVSGLAARIDAMIGEAIRG